MKVTTRLVSLKNERKPVVLAAGFFDGLHLGHRKVIGKTVAAAEKCEGTAWVLTFNTHPMSIVRPGSAPLLLTSNRHKLNLLKRMNLDGCLFLPFTKKLARTEPEAFVELLSRAIPRLTRIFVGENWRFGRGEKGNATMLVQLARRKDIGVSVVAPVRKGGRVVSSTRIRDDVVKGRLKEAADMLGRPFSILGTVVKGRAVGRRMGFPTANLETFNEVIPPKGVYAVHAMIGGRIINGAANIGVSPTFPGAARRKINIEVYLIGMNRNLYGREIEVFFVKKLRNEKRFKSVQKLREQIERDVRSSVKML